MSNVGQREVLTQQRVLRFFQESLRYAYLGNRRDRDGNGNVEKALLTGWLQKQRHGDKLIAKVLRELDQAAALSGSKTLYDANRDVYSLLRYGVKVRPDVGERNVTVWLIDWKNPENNDMVWLAKWIREHVADARVLLITDRTELDEQIEKVFSGVCENIHRTRSGADLVRVLNAGEEWLICSLVHKFGASEDTSDRDIDAYVDEIKKSLPQGFRAKGDIFVFVDECHRTQSGKLHEAMKALLPGAMLIGFTGTPLLKKDKQKSIEVFGRYIHTYKYDEAVRDGVVLDLRYEARDIDQNITSQEKVDRWFELKTRGLSDWARAQLKQRWGTIQKVLSSQDRLAKIVADILLDMETRDRLKSGHGNALLVSGSIYSACRFFEMFQKTDLTGKCAIVTSYRPNPGDIKGEESGEGLTEKLRQYDIYRKMLAAYFNEPEESAMYKVEKFEQEVKKRFRELIDEAIPQWRLYREELNRAPLAHEEWRY